MPSLDPPAALAAISYDPLVSIDIGPLSVSPHGIFTAIGVLVAAVFFLRDVRVAGIDGDEVSQILTRAVVAALLGARLAYVLNHLSRFDSPLEVLKVWEGGASLLGGITAAVAVGMVEMRRRGLPALKLFDLAAPWFTLGIAIGRIGDLIIADHLGKTTSVPFGFECPSFVDVGDTVGSPCPPGEIVHLTAAYDLLAAAAITLVVLAIRRRAPRPGVSIGVTALLYGLTRFGLDSFRADAVRLGLTGSQWTGLALAATGIAVLVWSRRQADTGEEAHSESAGAAVGPNT